MDRLVEIAVSRRYLMVGLLVVVMIGGLVAFKQLNIEAYPDPTPPMVDIVTQSPGLSSEEIERYITIPIETQVAGIKNLRTIRTISLYGLSDVKLQFSFDYTYDEALQQVLNRLSQLAPLPGNVLPQISPLSAIGEIYRYRLAGPPNYSVLDLKTLQDWVLQRRFRAVPGVVDVIGWGGKTKTFELQVDFNKLVAYGLTLPQLLHADSVQRVGCNRLHCTFRDFRHERHHHPVAVQSVDRGRRRSDRCDPANRRNSDASGADDLRDCRRRAAAGRGIHRDRLASTKAARRRRGRRNDARPRHYPDYSAGPDCAVLAASAAAVER